MGHFLCQVMCTGITPLSLAICYSNLTLQSFEWLLGSLWLSDGTERRRRRWMPSGDADDAEILKQQCIHRYVPDWLPFLPGQSYFVPDSPHLSNNVALPFLDSKYLAKKSSRKGPSSKTLSMNEQFLAQCYLSNDQSYRAHHLLQGKHLPESRYWFAQACFATDLHLEAQKALSEMDLHQEAQKARIRNYSGRPRRVITPSIMKSSEFPRTRLRTNSRRPTERPPSKTTQTMVLVIIREFGELAR